MSQDILLRLQYVWKRDTNRNLIKNIGAHQLKSDSGICKITHKKVMNDMQALKDRLEY
mgnify:CR=1 FL=1